MATPAFAQGGRSEIIGTILDSGKAVLPGVTVTATNEATGLERSSCRAVKASSPFRRCCPAPTPSRPICRAFRRPPNGLVLNVGQELTINLTLQIAGVAETLAVTGQSPLVETTSSRIGTNVTSTEIDGLPSANRSQFSLMQTIPGWCPCCRSGRSKAASSAPTARRPRTTCSWSTGRTTTTRGAAARRARRRACRSTRWPNTRCRRISTAPSTAARPASSSTA